MLRVVKEEEGDLLDGEVPVPLDEESYRMSYQIITDPKFPGQFRVVGREGGGREGAREEGREGGREGNRTCLVPPSSLTVSHVSS